MIITSKLPQMLLDLDHPLSDKDIEDLKINMSLAYIHYVNNRYELAKLLIAALYALGHYKFGELISSLPIDMPRQIVPNPPMPLTRSAADELMIDACNHINSKCIDGYDRTDDLAQALSDLHDTLCILR
jgi:hypothetical protein